MLPEGTTQRLILRPLVLEDAAQIQQLFPHWEIVRYLRNFVPWPFPPDGARKYFEEVALPAMEQGEEFYWTLRLKAEPECVIGLISLSTVEDDNRGF